MDKKKLPTDKIKQHFLRDGRAPIPALVATSRVMSANRGESTVPELMMRRALRSLGLRGYRLNWKGVPGRPDIAFTSSKVAVFIHGCYWHRCPYCRLPLPKSHRPFWIAKFRRNRNRDARKERELVALGWQVIVFWECEIKEDVESCASDVQRRLTHAGSR